MAYLINRQLLTEARIRAEQQRIGGQPQWQNVADESQRAQYIRAAAEQSAIDLALMEQAAAGDPRPVDREAIEAEVARQKEAAGCRTAFDDSAVRQAIELQFRMQRLQEEMTAGAAKPSAGEAAAFYETYGENFRNPEMFRAAHIVKHVNGEQTEAQARAGMEAALGELEGGLPFAEVAARHSDCKDNGGDLGQFPAGHMVQEFEDALRAVAPGQRTGIFRTPFGFHIAELRGCTPACQASFEEVRADIERVMEMQNKHEAFLRGIQELRARADIRYAPE